MGWEYQIINYGALFVQVIMRWRVQLGINSTSDVWKSCQNWTSCLGGVGIFHVKPVELSPPS